MSATRRPLADRFWAKVEKTDTCWIWTGSTSPKGYGEIGAGGDRGRTLRAHRVAYELVVGPIPDGMQLDHLCRVRNCVNPDHLEPVTPRENQLRGEGQGGLNARKTHCPRGHAYDAANTGDDRGRRYCLTCARERQRALRAARKQKAA